VEISQHKNYIIKGKEDRGPTTGGLHQKEREASSHVVVTGYLRGGPPLRGGGVTPAASPPRVPDWESEYLALEKYHTLVLRCLLEERRRENIDFGGKTNP